MTRLDVADVTCWRGSLTRIWRDDVTRLDVDLAVDDVTYWCGCGGAGVDDVTRGCGFGAARALLGVWARRALCG